MLFYGYLSTKKSCFIKPACTAQMTLHPYMGVTWCNTNLIETLSIWHTKIFLIILNDHNTQNIVFFVFAAVPTLHGKLHEVSQIYIKQQVCHTRSYYKH